jgi:hypothetical protein
MTGEKAAARAQARRPVHTPAAAANAFVGPATIAVRKTSKESGPGEIAITAPATAKVISATKMDIHFTVTLLARLRGLSGSWPRKRAR